MRFFYSLYHAMRCRGCLAAVFRMPTINDINLKTLKNQRVKIIALDFDGVLAAHGETFPHAQAEQWLMQSIEMFGKENIFILSNNPFKERQRYFEKLGVRFITSVKKKPYPDGLYEIARIAQVNLKEIVLVDDRLLTGILATCLAQTQGILITQPYQNLSKCPIKERFFGILRWLEQHLFLL